MQQYDHHIHYRQLTLILSCYKIQKILLFENRGFSIIAKKPLPNPGSHFHLRYLKHCFYFFMFVLSSIFC